MAGYREIPARGLLGSLVQVLLKAPVLGDLDGRRMVIQIMGDELGRPFMVEEYSKTSMHLFSIADACRRSPGGLRALVKALEYLEPGALSTAAVRHVVTQMTPLDSWSAEEQRELFALLTGIVVPDAIEIYRFVGGSAAPDLADDCSYEEMVLALDTLNANAGGLPKTLVFVEHVAARVRVDLAVKLRRWVEERAANMNLLVELREVRRQLSRTSIPTSPQPRLPAYLIFMLQHEGLGSGLRLSSWKQLDVTGGWFPERGGDFSGTLDDVKRQVASLIEGVESEWAKYVPDIRIEFVLPADLLNLDVDQWQWEVESSLPQPLGSHFVVAVRSLERMQKPQWHRVWYARWAVLESQVYAAGMINTECGHWSAAADPASLRELTAFFERRPDIVALMPRTPPLPGGLEELMVGLRAGMPVVVWHRKDCADDEFTTTVKAFLHTSGPELLLDRVRAVRSNAYGQSDQQHAGAHMTVLWDDPKRMVMPDRPAPPEEVT
jgi:hypothetical protein